MVPHDTPVDATNPLGALAAAIVGSQEATASELWGNTAFDGN